VCHLAIIAKGRLFAAPTSITLFVFVLVFVDGVVDSLATLMMVVLILLSLLLLETTLATSNASKECIQGGAFVLPDWDLLRFFIFLFLLFGASTVPDPIMAGMGLPRVKAARSAS
jgi:hypothetical protein